MRRPLVAGNWKMHGARTDNAQFIEALSMGLPEQLAGDVALCPPFVYLWEMARLLKDSNQQPVRIALGHERHADTVQLIQLVA